MNVLILSRQTFGGLLAGAYKDRLSLEGYNDVDFAMKLKNCSNALSYYDVVIAHPVKEDFAFLYEEANNRKDFKLIFFKAGSLNKVDPSTQFKNKNVFVEEGFLSPSRLIEIINGDK